MAQTAFDPASGRLSTATRVGDVAAAPDRADHHSQLVCEVARRAAMPTLGAAAVTARATLRSLGEWLDADLRSDIARHLPGDVAAAPVSAEVSGRQGDVVALYRRVASVADDHVSLHEVALRCAAVLAVLGETLPCPLVDRLTAALPPDISALVVLPRNPQR